MKRQILIVCDDLAICRTVQTTMQSDNATVASYVTSKAEALSIFAKNEYCLVIMDVQPPVDYALEMLVIMRGAKTTPILLLTPKLTISEKIALFQAGANACLEKPFDLAVCAAQANSLIQLYVEATVDYRDYHPLIFGTELIINPMYRQVIIDGELLMLTRTEFDLLFCLAHRPGQVWSMKQLYDHLWSDELGFGGEHTVKTHIGNLRKNWLTWERAISRTLGVSDIDLSLLLMNIEKSYPDKSAAANELRRFLSKVKEKIV